MAHRKYMDSDCDVVISKGKVLLRRLGAAYFEPAIPLDDIEPEDVMYHTEIDSEWRSK